MRAALFRRHGGPEVMEVADVPAPVPGPGEVSVRVTAAALNHVDLWVRRGLPALPVALPHVLGGDACGVVAALGPGVVPQEGAAVGDRVLLNPGLSCGRCMACLDGRDNFCPAYRMMGEQAWGAQAEEIVVPVQNLVPAPAQPGPAGRRAAGRDPDCLHDGVADVGRPSGYPAGRDGAGSRGGVRGRVGGRPDRQALRRAGHRDGVDRSQTGGRPGAGRGRNHRFFDGDLVAEVKRLTGRRGADIVVEHVGAATFPQSVVACAKGGRIVTCGATAGYEPVLNLRHVFWRQLSILGSTMASKSRLFALLDLFAAGRLRPVIDRVLPLTDIAAAHRLLESRATFGKLVLVTATG